MDSILSDHTSKERQPAAEAELPNDQLHQPSKQSHDEDHTEQFEKRRRSLLKNRQASKQKGTSKSRSSTYESAVQLDLYHVFIDFKKAFDRVWYAALRATMKKYISANLIQVIRNLYDEATSAVLFNGSIGDWVRTTVGVRRGCLLSPTLFNIFWKGS